MGSYYGQGTVSTGDANDARIKHDLGTMMRDGRVSREEAIHKLQARYGYIKPSEVARIVDGSIKVYDKEKRKEEKQISQSQQTQASLVDGNGVSLDVPWYGQSESGWCGRASQQMIILHAYSTHGYDKDYRKDAQQDEKDNMLKTSHINEKLVELSKRIWSSDHPNTKQPKQSDKEWLKGLGFKYVGSAEAKTEKSFDPVISSLDNGHPVIVYTDLGSQKQHIFVLTGYNWETRNGKRERVFTANDTFKYKDAKSNPVGLTRVLREELTEDNLAAHLKAQNAGNFFIYAVPTNDEW